MANAYTVLIWFHDLQHDPQPVRRLDFRVVHCAWIEVLPERLGRLPAGDVQVGNAISAGDWQAAHGLWEIC